MTSKKRRRSTAQKRAKGQERNTRPRHVKGPEFRIGSAFPATDSNLVRLARFFVTMQPLVHTARTLHALRNKSGPAIEETVHGLKVQSLGPTNEALIAFKGANRPGVFDEAMRLANPEVRAAYGRLCNWAKDRAFRERLRLARNQPVAHVVDEDKVKEALTRLAERQVPVFEGTGGQTTADTATPFYEALVTDLLEAVMPGWEQFADEHLWQMQSDLWKVAHAAYGYYVAKALGTLQDGDES